MKTAIFDSTGKKVKDIELPSFFSLPVRDDIISKALEAKKSKQPYAPSPVAGKQTAASGKVVHRRHVWRSGYGRGISRIPRKVMTRKGSQFNWVGAEIASTRGGRRAHPPKIASMIKELKINKKEDEKALISAISATANKKQVAMKYQSIDEKDIKDLPIVVESKITSEKTKQLLSAIEKILGEKLFQVAVSKKVVRSGKGKSRGRKYKSNAGILVVTGKSENMKSNIFDTRNANTLSIVDLAEGGSGRITVYTEQAIKDLEEKLKQ
ncbi:MAG: 50S ribosomal protein L4 [Candidatus Pacearchaeota archaeon]|jgi:large subunit ribosomal protein L4e